MDEQISVDEGVGNILPFQAAVNYWTHVHGHLQKVGRLKKRLFFLFGGGKKGQ